MLSVARYVRGLFARPGIEQHSDVQLLHAFSAHGDQAAFTTLVERHGPLVWAVCRRSLGHTQDAEDAFQATFLILARRASNVSWREQIAGWLHAVAVRVTRKAREQAQRRRTLEKEAIAMKPPFSVEGDPELSAIIDEEIQRLPQKYRRPVVLCYLQGKTYTEAAEELGWRAGTVSGRLARARKLLQDRLTRRGLTTAGTALTVFLDTQPGSAAPPSELVRNTVQVSFQFAAGPVSNPDPASVLAEGVLRTMFASKLSIVGLLAVGVLAIGMGIGVAAFRPDPPDPPAERKVPPRPEDREAARPLPKAWENRWLADPFAGTVAIEVKHQGRDQPALVYHLKSPEAVTAVLKAVKIQAFRNGMHAGLIPPSFVTFHRKDGSRLEMTTMPTDTLQCRYGMLLLTEDFYTALNKELSKQEKRDIDILERLPDPPEKPQPKVIKPSQKGLESGFTDMEVNYPIARRLYRTHIKDAKTLEALHKQLSIGGVQPAKQGFPPSSNVTITCKDGSKFYGHIVNISEIFDHDAGTFILAPDFLKAINREVSRRAGREIDVTKNNAVDDKETRRTEVFRKLIAGAKRLRYVSEDKRELIVDAAEELKEVLGQMQLLGGPTTEGKIETRKRLIELTMADDKKIELQVAESGSALDSGPTLGNLLEVTGFGRVWIDNQWAYRVRDLIYKRDLEAEAKREAETSALVCEDLPTFLRQVKNIVAHYREEDSQLSNSVNGEAAQRIVRLMAAAKFEKLDWNEERWKREMEKILDAGGATLELTPGFGFRLNVVVSGPKEMLVYPYGRMTFKESPLEVLKKAIDEENARKVELLPKK